MTHASLDAGRTFDAAQYQRNAAFVPQLGHVILDWLDPRPGEVVLDLGAGDGVLTEELVKRGARVVAGDASPSMVEAARALGLDARLVDGEALTFDGEFDAVFSSAALHWMPDADGVSAGVFRALRPGGRFVAEQGGFGCVAAVRVALGSAMERAGVDASGADPWYFPTPEHHRAVLERAGFVVDEIVLVARPTVLNAGFAGWLETFGRAQLARVPEARRAEVLAHAVARLEATLRDEQGRDVADYTRLRFRAHKPR
ncbi:MAG: methyltransferase domain-containing protein [Polyangiales bacterium]